MLACLVSVTTFCEQETAPSLRARVVAVLHYILAQSEARLRFQDERFDALTRQVTPAIRKFWAARQPSACSLGDPSAAHKELKSNSMPEYQIPFLGD